MSGPNWNFRSYFSSEREWSRPRRSILAWLQSLLLAYDWTIAFGYCARPPGKLLSSSSKLTPVTLVELVVGIPEQGLASLPQSRYRSNEVSGLVGQMEDSK